MRIVAQLPKRAKTDRTRKKGEREKMYVLCVRYQVSPVLFGVCAFLFTTYLVVLGLFLPEQIFFLNTYNIYLKKIFEKF